MSPIIEHNVYTLLDFLVYGPRVAIVLLVLLACWPANASPAHCQHNGGAWHVCHICTRGHWPNVAEFECTKAEEARQERARR